MVSLVLLFVMGTGALDQDAEFCSGAYFTLQSVPIPGRWALDLERVSKAPC